MRWAVIAAWPVACTAAFSSILSWLFVNYEPGVHGWSGDNGRIASMLFVVLVPLTAGTGWFWTWFVSHVIEHFRYRRYLASQPKPRHFEYRDVP